MKLFVLAIFILLSLKTIMNLITLSVSYYPRMKTCSFGNDIIKTIITLIFTALSAYVLWG
jgi:hypothetical protein